MQSLTFYFHCALRMLRVSAVRLINVSILEDRGPLFHDALATLP